MRRRVLPPDFRFVWLTPDGSSTLPVFTLGGLGALGAGVGMWSAGHVPSAVEVGVGAGAIVALALAGRRPRRPPPGSRAVSMAVVPWGVVVAPETEPRFLRWSAIRRVSVDVEHTMQGGTPVVVSSLVTIATERETLVGRAPGAVDLEVLIANLEEYAEESGRLVASDLDGEEPVEDGDTEPVAAVLVRQATDLAAASTAAAQVVLCADYRNLGTRAGLVARLAAVISEGDEAPADPRPLAALLAATLGAVELLPHLLRLSGSPHPFVAAAAKAAALRLGAPPNRAGSVDEVAAFLFEDDARVLGDFARGGTDCEEPAEERPSGVVARGDGIVRRFRRLLRRKSAG